MSDIDDKPLSEDDARTLRFLRRLVTVLTATMIAGMALLVVLFATRLGGRSAPDPTVLTVPEQIELPAGARAIAITQGQGWWAVVTDGDDILIYDAQSGALRQQVRVTP